MRPGGGSVKGADFERLVSKQLSLWATNALRKDVFWRTAGSGSRGTTQGIETALGDIGSTHEIGRPLTSKVIIECKCYRRVDWSRFFFEGRGEIGLFWWQLSEVCDKWKKWPLLLVKENNRPVVMVVDTFIHHTAFAPLVTICAQKARHPRNFQVQYLDDLLRLPYSHFTEHLASFPYAPATYHRSAPDSTPRARIPTSVS